MLGVLLEFGGGVGNMIGHILILFGLGGIALGLSRKIICAEIRYSQGKIYYAVRSTKTFLF